MVRFVGWGFWKLYFFQPRSIQAIQNTVNEKRRKKNCTGHSKVLRLKSKGVINLKNLVWDFKTCLFVCLIWCLGTLAVLYTQTGGNRKEWLKSKGLMLFNLHRRNYISFVTPTKQSKNQIRTKKQTSPDLIPTETPFTAARFSPKAFLKYFVRFSMRSIKPFSFRIRCLSSATSVSSTRFVPSERFSLKKKCISKI